MNTYAGRRRSFLLAVLILLLSILLEQYWLVRLFPWMGGLGSIRPMIVFLDIPLDLPLIDPIPVGILFSFFYSIVIAPGISRSGGSIGPALRKKTWAALMGLTILLICMLAGGGLFYLLQDTLPRTVRNGIDSFGVRADVYLPYPGEGRIHLRGSMLLLLCCYAGVRIWMRMMKESAPTHTEFAHAGEAARMRGSETVRMHGRETVRTNVGVDAAAVMARGMDATAGIREGKRISMQVPEPVLVAVGATGVSATGVGATGVGATGMGTTGIGATGLGTAVLPGAVRVLRPEAGMGRGRMYPCVVDTEMLRPARK